MRELTTPSLLMEWSGNSYNEILDRCIEVKSFSGKESFVSKTIGMTCILVIFYLITDA